MKRWLAVIIAIAYTVSPIDLLPDVLPVFGWFDDAGVDLMAILYFLYDRRRKKRIEDESFRREGRLS